MLEKPFSGELRSDIMESDSEDLDISLFSEKIKDMKKKFKTKKKKVKNEVYELRTQGTQSSETANMDVKHKKNEKSINSERIDEVQRLENQKKKIKKRAKSKKIMKDSVGDNPTPEEGLDRSVNSNVTNYEELKLPKDKSKSIRTSKAEMLEQSSKWKRRYKNSGNIVKKIKEKTNFEDSRSNTKSLTKIRSRSIEQSSDLSNSESDDDANFESETMEVSKDLESSSSEDNTEMDGHLLDDGDSDMGPQRQRSQKLKALPGDGHDSESNEEDKYAAIKKELANIPLEDLVKIKEKLGLKAFSKIMHVGKFEEAKKTRVFKRENKNRPMEMSSKRPVPVLRHMDVPKKKIQRDPRFDDLSGEYKEEYFERNYSFLQDVKDKEREIVKKKLKKLKNEEKKQKLQYLLNRMNQQEQSTKQRQKQKQLESSLKQKEKELIKEGKTPFFLKKAERRKLELAEKYKELQKSGKMDQYLSRKRKKNAQKEKKKLPGKHSRFS